MKYNVQLVGVGGQGVLLASMVIGNAALIEGLEVATSEVHGMAQRGGSVMCSVRLGNDILSPLIPKGSADLLVGFEPAETLRSLPLINTESWIVTSTAPILPVNVAIGAEEYPTVPSMLEAIRKEDPRMIAIDATLLAEKAGNIIAANSVLIGAMTSVNGFPISKERMLGSLLDVVPQKARDVNVKAFDIGYDEGKKASCLIIP